MGVPSARIRRYRPAYARSGVGNRIDWEQALFHADLIDQVVAAEVGQSDEKPAAWQEDTALLGVINRYLVRNVTSKYDEQVWTLHPKENMSVALALRYVAPL